MSQSPTQTDNRIAPASNPDYWNPQDLRRVHDETGGDVELVAAHYRISTTTARKWLRRHEIIDDEQGGVEA